MIAFSSTRNIEDVRVAYLFDNELGRRKVDLVYNIFLMFVPQLLTQLAEVLCWLVEFKGSSIGEHIWFDY